MYKTGFPALLFCEFLPLREYIITIKHKIMRFLTLLICFLIASVSYAQHPAEDWYHTDPSESNMHGVATHTLYKTLLKDRASETVIVAIIDSGVDHLHEDLKDVMWVNDDEIPDNGIDDDNNGYVDDIHGWNFIGGPDGKNLNKDTYEATRLYGKLKYKYENAVESKLTKEQKKEYAVYLRAKESVESNRESAMKSLERIEGEQKTVTDAVKAVQMALDTNAMTMANIDSIDATDNPQMITGKRIMSNVMTREEGIGSFDDVYELIEKSFADGRKRVQDRLDYAYNPDFRPRPEIVGDNYADSYEKGYGNNDSKGPDSFHGTHVAGIVAATRNNDLGMDGIADNVKIMSVRAVPDGDERDKDVANAIIYAVDNGASIINMSFGKGFSWDKKAVDDAVAYAQKNDVLLVHAAGNSAQNNDTEFNYPNDKYEKARGFWFWKKKKMKNWIEVGALSHKVEENSIARFSNYGKENVDIFAPGQEIYATIPEDGYAYLQGTSMASPVVAGVAAILRSYFPSLKAEQVKEILLNSSVKSSMDVVVPGMDGEKKPFNELSVSGGMVNAYRAVEMAMKTKGKKKVNKKKSNKA